MASGNASMEDVVVGQFEICGYIFIVSLKSQSRDYAAQWLSKIFSRFKTTTDFDGKVEVSKAPISKWELPHGSLRLFSSNATSKFTVELNTSQHSEIAQSLSQVEISIINYAVSKLESSIWLHGAGLVKDDKIIFLIAPSGGGKTTLSLGLLSHGFKALTDDVIVIAKERFTIQPFPRCPKIRSTAPSQLRAFGYDLFKEAELIGRYVILPKKSWVSSEIQASKARKTFFILSPQQSQQKPEELDAAETMIELARCSNFLYQDNQELSLLKKLLHNASTYKLPISDLKKNMDQILTLVQRQN